MLNRRIMSNDSKNYKTGQAFFARSRLLKSGLPRDRDAWHMEGFLPSQDPLDVADKFPLLSSA